jgi:hypothetical protein
VCGSALDVIPPRLRLVANLGADLAQEGLDLLLLVVGEHVRLTIIFEARLAVIVGMTNTMRQMRLT